MSEDATLDEFVDVEYSVDRVETPIGKIPENWGVERLNDVADINPDSFTEDDWSSETFEYISLSEASSGRLLESKTTALDEAPSRAQRRVQKGDILVGTVRPKQESHGFVTDKHDGNICSSGFGVLRTGGNLNPLFLIQEILSHRFFSQMDAYVAGSGYPAVKIGDLKKHRISIPTLEEQRKIATILHNIDQAIQKTEEVIEQTKCVEQGLSQRLFSGYHLDCEHEESSTLGETPIHWDDRPMGEACEITMGSSPKSEYYNEHGQGLPFFQANNEFGLRSPTHNRWCSDPIKIAEANDVLMTVRGTYVGQVNIADRECCIGRGLAGISAGDSLLPEYLYHHLRRRERYVKSIAIGSTFDSVTSSELYNLMISVPPLEEQRGISNTLKNIQNYEIHSNKYLERLQRLKKALMQDLLSGKVQTADTSIAIPDEIQRYG
ncbi:restriction endonuclease subunit S [Halocatena salina]|uniref:Restriction endonuclease subunit S n=1 Tax=Halocatena salina TaxID=2934340 RepID=A0A8U0A242_9EURY|nr:restriction endonuclease subunit S [Halocatena salina]UPM42057.1 restriction endonuclease subunit S [Halocatena salina]